MPEIPNNLIIVLKADIVETNIREFKDSFLTYVDAINTNLETDNDFGEAATTIKTLRRTEKLLEAAKLEGISQSKSINNLFSEIDHLIYEAQEKRKSLNKTVGSRLKEIKKNMVQVGLDKIQGFIDEQSKDFKLIDTSLYTNKEGLEKAIKYKQNVKTAERAIVEFYNKTKSEILTKASSVAENAAMIDDVTPIFKSLLHDRGTLLDKTKEELILEIDKRIASYHVAKNKESKPTTAPPVRESKPTTAPPVRESKPTTAPPEIDYASQMEPENEEHLFKVVRRRGKIEVISNEGEIIELSERLIDALEQIRLQIHTDWLENNNKDRQSPNKDRQSLVDSLDHKEKELYEILRRKKNAIAVKEGASAPYIIFQNDTLAAMAKHKPNNKREMIELRGVSESKYEKYGDIFLSEINKFCGRVYDE